MARAGGSSLVPITITQPLPGQPTGPGFITGWSSDFIGPLPTGTHWQLSYRDAPPGEVTFWSLEYDATGPIATVISGLTPTGVAVPAARSATPHGDTAQFVVQLVNPQGQILDQGATDITWDAISGNPYLNWQMGAGSTTGGYTAADRQVAAQTKDNTLASFPGTELAGQLLELGLDQLAACPPLPLLVESATILLTGSGTVDRPSGATGVSAYGFRFRWEVVPGGLSVIDGRALEYPERLAQFLLIRVDAAGREYVSDRYDFHHDQERICWGIPFPKRLEYYFLPGVSARFSWLLFPIGQRD